MSPAGASRVAGRLAAAAALLLVAVPLHAGWQALRRLTILRRPSPWPRRVLGAAARIVGARVTVRGPVPARGLLVANHTSWLDILVLGGVTGCAFVARRDLNGVPVVGALCRANRTVFVERGSRADVGAQVAALRAALTSADAPVTVFPEGTTGAGPELLPFKAALFAALEPPVAGVPLIPARLDYDAAGGAAGGAELAWVDDEPGLANMLRVLARPGGFPVALRFGEAVEAIAHPGRKALAAEARRRIEEL